MEQVIVTAQRREQSAQDVGVALSVISGDQLAARGWPRSTSCSSPRPAWRSPREAPAAASPASRLRGVGFDDYASNNSSTVGVSVDGGRLPDPGPDPGPAVRHRPGGGATRPARHAVRPQHHRRGDQASSPTARPAR
ncbi:hypothetical protein ACRAWD_20355 [Caulobacter segnis]